MATQTTTTTTAPATSKQIGTLYAGDLHPDVTEGVLYSHFSPIGNILSIRVCRDMVTRKSLGYAYVNYQDPNDAKTALENLNFEEIQGRPIRIMWSNRDPSVRKSVVGNVFIKNLCKTIEVKQLYDTFVAYGNILSCKIATDDYGKSKGYGFIHFETQEGADGAIEGVNGMILVDKRVYVGKFVPKQERSSGDAVQKFTNCFVKNFGEELDTPKLEELFSKYGEITSAQAMMDQNDKPKGFGFVCYKDPASAEAAVKELHGFKIGDKSLYVSRAQKKQERLEELRVKFEKQKIERTSHYQQGVNLYVKQLDDDVDDQGLKEMFQRFGNITSAKVMRDSNGRTKNFGFVCFSSPSEATCAISEMNAKIWKTKPLYVTIAQRKEERKSRLTNQYLQRMTQMRGGNVQNAAGQYLPNMQAAQAATNPQIQNMLFQQQLNAQRFYMPNRANPTMLNQNRWNGQFPFAQQQAGAAGLFQARQLNPNAMQVQYNAAAAAQNMNVNQQTQAAANLFNQQRQLNQNAIQATNVNPAANAQQNINVNHPQQQASIFQRGQMNQAAIQNQNAAPAANQQQNLTGQASKILVDSDPEKRRQWLGERLYPKVVNIDSELAGRLTGMLLELDHTELLHMLENEDNLKAKVEEAKIVMSNKPRGNQMLSSNQADTNKIADDGAKEADK